MGVCVYLVRHGTAEGPSPILADEERSLTSDAREELARAAVGLRRLEVAPGIILVSPLVRASQTGFILGRLLCPERSIQMCPVLAPGNSLSAILTVLAENRQAQQIVVVGHEPTMGELASCLLTASPSAVRLRFKPGAVAAIDLASLPPEGPGWLRWFIRVEQLAEIGQV